MKKDWLVKLRNDFFFVELDAEWLYAEFFYEQNTHFPSIFQCYNYFNLKYENDGQDFLLYETEIFFIDSVQDSKRDAE